jgi:hypothetical protein
MRRTATALLLLALALPALAGKLQYSSGTTRVSVTQANSAVSFTDNGSGGTSSAFYARTVWIRSDSTSANSCYFDLKDTTATTADIRLAPGDSIVMTWADTLGGNGWAGLGAICAAGETATFDVVAVR